MSWVLSCNKHWGAWIFLNYSFLWIYAQEWHYRNLLLTLFLLFKGPSILFSIAAVPIYTPTNSVGGLLFLHRPSVFIKIICRLSRDGHSDQCEVMFHYSFSCLENSMDGGAWWATVHGDAKSWTHLSDFTKISNLGIFSCACWPSVCLLWRNVS